MNKDLEFLQNKVIELEAKIEECKINLTQSTKIEKMK
jgi:hypothetical protein